MAAIVDLLQAVAQKVRRCPEPTLVKAYRDAAIEFTRQSRWLRRTILPDLEAGDDFVALTLIDSQDADLQIIGVRNIRAYSESQPQSDWPLLPSDSTTWRLNQDAAQPCRYAYVPESQIQVPAPSDQAYVLRVIAQCMPIETAESLPDDLLAKWQRFLDAGARSYLFDIPGQAWSDPAAARREAIYFQAGINNARNDEQRSFNTGTSMARIPRVF